MNIFDASTYFYLYLEGNAAHIAFRENAIGDNVYDFTSHTFTGEAIKATGCVMNTHYEKDGRVQLLLLIVPLSSGIQA